MATFHITAATSVSTTGNGVHAFQSNTGPADKLVVDEGAYLIATGANAAGALLATSDWTVIINGSVFSQQYVGLRTNAPLNLTVGINGEIGGTIGVESFGSATTINNAGIIAGSQWAIQDTTSGNTTIDNSGLLDGDLQLDAAMTSLTNSGRIAGLVAAGGKLKLVNSGSIDEFVSAGGSADTVNNSGAIGGSVDLGSGSDTVTNSGTIAGTVTLGEGTNKLTNSGTLGNFVTGVSAGAGDDTFFNSGTINGSVETGGGNNMVENTNTITGAVILLGGAGTTDTLINSGTIGDAVGLSGGTNSLTNHGTISGFVDFASAVNDTTIKNTGTIEGLLQGDEGTHTIINSGTLFRILLNRGDDHVTNSGTITTTVELGEDNDVFTGFRLVAGVMKSGTVLGTIDMGLGDDSFTGGANAEQLRDNGGADTANFGAGRDVYLAAHNPLVNDGNDSLNGGKGVDTYDAGDSGTAVLINLDSVQHDLSDVFANAASVAANTAVGDAVAGPGLTDSIVGFENAIGSGYDDTIYGTGGMNTLDGGIAFGADALFGFAGADTLLGGSGADFLAGGAGKDMLSGGADAEVDTFAFLALGDSGVTAATRDVIADFEDGADQISLSAIDADSSTGVDDPFTFLGTNVGFNGTAGALRAYWTVTGQVIEGDVNGDGAADFSIKLTDADHSIVLGTSDFML